MKLDRRKKWGPDVWELWGEPCWRCWLLNSHQELLGNTQLLPTWRITTGCNWLFQLNQPYKFGISWFIHPYGWVATRCFNNLFVLIFSVYHCIHQFRSSGHPRSVTTRSSSRLGPQPQVVPTPLVLPSASEAPAQLT